MLNQNQTYHVHRHQPRDYGTDVYVGLTDRFIRGAARAAPPVLRLPVGVHTAPTRDAGAAKTGGGSRTRACSRTPSFDQADVSRCTGVRARPARSSTRRRRTPSTCSTASGSAPCRPSTVVWRAWCTRCGRRSSSTTPTSCSRPTTASTSVSTACPPGKQTPYETDIHVPLLVRGPGVRAGAHVTRLAGNTDLAPTFEAMAGASSPSFTDGRSLLPAAPRRAPRALAHLVPARAPQRDRA